MEFKKLLITGSDGFIGSKLIRVLSKKNYLIYCLYRQNKYDFGNNTISIYQDFRKQLVINKLPDDVDIIIHLAADMSKTTGNPARFQINTVSTLDLLEYGKKVGIKNFIFASTGGVYGYANQPHNEDSSMNPIDFYALSKYESELLVNYYSKYFTTIILRLFFPYGLEQVKGIIPLLTNKIIKKERIIVYNDNNPIINPIHIKNVIEFIDKILLFNGKYMFNVAGNEMISIKEISEIISEYIGLKPNFEYIKDTNILNLIGDNTQMREIIGSTNIISFNHGLQEYLKSMKQYGV